MAANWRSRRIDDPDSPIGTDPLKVMEAIESVADTVTCW